MSVSAMHLFQQGRGLYSTLRVAASAIGGRPDSMSELPGPEICETISVIPDDLIDAAVRWAGGDPAAYSDILPPWMFAWWGIPVFAQLVTTTPFPPLRIVNQGFAVQQLKHLPRGQDLLLRARVMDVSEAPTKYRLHLRLVTGTEAAPDAQIVDLHAVIPRSPDPDAPPRKRRDPAMVDPDWERVVDWENGRWAGLEFALLTGDFNPIHWVPAAARMSGFGGCILHGFGVVARGLEHLARERWSGGMADFAAVDVRFTAPLVLPAQAGLFLGPPVEASERARAMSIGPGPGERACVLGSVTTR